jgi:hypothetical protein
MRGALTEEQKAEFRDFVRMIAGTDIVRDGDQIHNDLDVTADDVVEILDYLAQRYGTNFRGLDLKKYTQDVMEASFFVPLRWLGLRPGKRATGFTVGHLMKVAERGIWFEPIND